MGYTLLIVEDDTFLVKAYQAQFDDSTYALVFANDGDQALQCIDTHHIDAIILDLVMPQKSGIDFLKKLRANPSNKNIPVVVATNMSAPNEKDQCEKLGISGYCIKSDVSISDIVGKVKQALQK